MTSVGELTAALTLNVSGFTGPAKTAETSVKTLKSEATNAGDGLRKMGSDADGAGGRLDSLKTHSDGLTGALGGVAKIAAGFVVAKGLMELPGVFKGIVGAASDMNESVSKSQQVFGESQAVIVDFAKNSATSLGATKQATIESAATFGNLFTAIGLTRPAAADLSVGIIKLGTDLASFNNIGTDEALEKLRSGLVGESEPLRSLGVNLTEATVKAQGLKMGLGDAHGELSEGAKVQARYALIMEQTKNAQGDFARTSDGLANQTKILSAEIGDAKEQFGELLLPAVLAVTQALVGAIPVVIEMAETFGELLSRAIDGISDSLGGLASTFEDQINGIISFLEPAASTIYDLLSYINPFATHSPSIVSQVQDGVDEIIAQYGRLPGSLDALKTAARELLDKQTELNEKIKSSETVIDGYKGKIDELKTKIGEYKAKIDDAKRALDGFASANLAEEAPFNAAGKNLQTQIDQLTLAQIRLKQQGPLTQEVSETKFDAKGKATTTTKTVDTAIGLQVKALQEQIEQLGLAASANDIERKLKIDPLKDKIRDLTDTTKTLTFDEIIKGILESKGVIAEFTGKQTEAESQLKLTESAMADEQKALGLLKGELKTVTDQLALYNKAIQQLEPKAGGGGTAAAVGKIQAPAAKINDFDPRKSATLAAEAIQKEQEHQNAIERTIERYKELGSTVGDTVSTLWGQLGPIGDLINGTITTGFKIIAALGAKVGEVFKDELMPAIRDARPVLEAIGKVIVVITGAAVLALLVSIVAALAVALTAIIVVFRLTAAALIVLEAAFELIAPVVQKLWDKLKDWGGWVKDDLVPGVQGAFGDVTGAITSTKDWIVEHWDEGKEKLSAFGSWLKDPFYSGISGVFGDAKDRIAEVKDWIVDHWDEGKEKLSAFGSWLKDPFYSGIKGVFTDIKDAIAVPKDWIVEHWHEGEDKLAAFMGWLRDPFVKDIKQLFADIVAAGQSVIDWAGGAWASIQEKLMAPIQPVIDLIQRLINKIKEIPTKISLPSLPSVGNPMNIFNADGDSYSAGGWRVVGERGPELVKMPRGAAVFSTEQSRVMASGASKGSGIHFSGDITINATDPDQGKSALDMLGYMAGLSFQSRGILT